MSKENREKRINSKSEALNSKQIQNPNDQNSKPTTPTTDHSSLVTFLALLLVIIAQIVTYWNSLEGGFHFDDYSKIVENPDIRTLKGVFVDGPKRSEPRMVSNFTLYLNYKFDGYNVRYYHAFNIGLHVINYILIYFVVMLMLRQVGIDKRYLAFLTSLFFALHPINTEPLNYIVHGRFIILCMMFYLLGMLFFILAFEAGRRKWLYLTLCFISYILSVFSKEVGITLPGVLFFYYLYFICDSKKAFLKAMALFGVAMALVITYALWYGIPGIIKDNIFGVGGSPFVALMIELLTQLNVAIIYLKLYILPLPSFLNVDHFTQFIPHSADGSRFYLDTQAIFSIIVIAGLIFTTLITYKKHRLISFSLIYLFITHSPTTLTRKGEIIAEYKNYLPFFGFAFLAILCLSKIFSYLGLGKKGAVVATLIILTFFSFAVAERNEVWRNELTLWDDCVSKTPNNVRGYSNRGNARGKIGDHKGAIEDFNKAIELNPNYERAYYNRGIAKSNLSDFKGAIEDYNKAIELNPNFEQAYDNRGNAKSDLGDSKGAIEDYNRAIRLDPNHSQAYFNLGNAKFNLGDSKGTIEDYNKAIELDPNYANAYNSRGLAKFNLGDFAGAIKDLEKAIELNPSYKEMAQLLINEARAKINK